LIFGLVGVDRAEQKIRQLLQLIINTILLNFKSGKGFEILSVSLDQNEVAWEKAIEKDQLAWPYHVSDLQGWSNAAA
jgi:hypothetical protein